MSDGTTDIAIDNQQSLAGKRFYQPWALAVYCVAINIPFALFFYGVNIYRRGNTLMGNIIKVAAAIAFVVLIIPLSKTNFSFIRYLLFSIVIGIGLAKAESSGYRQAISRGALPAKWWPPLLIMFILTAVIIALIYINEKFNFIS